MTTPEPSIERTALISDCGLYRYSLTRRWGPGRLFAAFVMLNPSTADHNVDDPTIRRCIDFSRSWGYDALEVVNLFALRSPDPRALRETSDTGFDPVGPENDRWIESVCGRAAACVAAWGAHPFAKDRAAKVLALRTGIIECLGTTADGSPRHPLYVAKSQRLVRFRSEEPA